jgi:OOP family OmpA-OmpF porin
MSRQRSPGSLGNAARSFGPLLLLAMIALACAPAQVSAQTGLGLDAGGAIALPSGGWYSGLSAGRSQVGIRDSLVPTTGAALSRFDTDDSNTGFKFYGGYRFNRNVTLEGGYADFGKFDSQREMMVPAFGSLSSGIRASGFYVGAVGVVPLPNRFSLFGKLGTGYTTNQAFVSTSSAMLTPADLGARRTEWNSKYGLGASYEMSNKLGLRFEYERSNSLGYGGAGDGNVGMWSLGLTRRY